MRVMMRTTWIRDWRRRSSGDGDNHKNIEMPTYMYDVKYKSRTMLQKVNRHQKENVGMLNTSPCKSLTKQEMQVDLNKNDCYDSLGMRSRTRLAASVTRVPGPNTALQLLVSCNRYS